MDRYYEDQDLCTSCHDGVLERIEITKNGSTHTVSRCSCCGSEIGVADVEE